MGPRRCRRLGTSSERKEEESTTNFLARLFGRRPAEAREELGVEPAPAIEAEQQAVIVYLRLSDPEFTNEREQARLFALEDQVMATCHESGAGMYDTNEVERGYLRLYMYGPDANRLAEVIAPVLRDAPRGSYLVKRYGPSGADLERVELQV